MKKKKREGYIDGEQKLNEDKVSTQRWGDISFDSFVILLPKASCNARGK